MVTEEEEYILMASLLSVVGLIAIIGNCSILLAVYKNTNLRTPANFCLVNLAVANILQGLIAIPVRVIGLQDIIPCVVIVTLVRMLQGASNIALSLVSLDRFAAVTQPFYYQPLVSTRRTLTAILCSWSVPISVSLLAITDWARKRSSHNMSCTCNFSATVTQHYFWLNETLLTFLPLLIMVFAYVCIFSTSRRHILKIHEQRSSLRRKRKQTSNRQSHNSISKKRVSFFGCVRKELQVIKVIAVLAGIFVILVIPSDIVNIIEIWRTMCVPKALREALIFLDYSNACVSALVYAGFSSEYRETFRRMWTHWKDIKDISAHCRPNSSESVLLRSRSSSTRSQCENKESKEGPVSTAEIQIEKNLIVKNVCRTDNPCSDLLLPPPTSSKC